MSKNEVTTAVNQALAEWEASIGRKHQEETCQLMEEMNKRLKEKDHQMQVGLKNVVTRLQQSLEEKDAEIAALKHQVDTLQQGWAKDRQEWEMKTAAVHKDLDTSHESFLDFLTCT